MKKTLLFALLLVSAAAQAQNVPLEGISESTDPEKVREVERRAQEIISRQQQQAPSPSEMRSRGASEDERSTRSERPRRYEDRGSGKDVAKDRQERRRAREHQR